MKRLIQFLRIHFLFSDALLIVLLFFGIRALLLQFSGLRIEDFIKENRIILYPIFLSSGLTLLGFLLTGINIIIIFLQNEKLSRLQNTDHPKTIVKIYLSAIKYTSILSLFSFIGMICTTIPYENFIISILLLLTTVRLFRCIWVIEKIAFLIYNKNCHKTT